MEVSAGAGAGGSGRSVKARLPAAASVPPELLPGDLLLNVLSRLRPFDIVRCGAVCRGWHHVVRGSLVELFLPWRPGTEEAVPEESIRQYIQELGMYEHKSALLDGSGEVHQWIGHSNRAYLCRMKRGSILTTGANRMLRLWTAEHCEFVQQYKIPEGDPLVDCDFDENKIVGLSSSQLAVWKRSQEKCLFLSRKGLFVQGLCMSYLDPEVVIGCEDGRARIFDMYSRTCSGIIKLFSGPMTCSVIIDENVIAGGSVNGAVSLVDRPTGGVITCLRSAMSLTHMKCLSYNPCSSLLFAGSSSGYVHCWDLRVLKPLWEKRASPNVVQTVGHLLGDASLVAAGGLDGILRILDQNTGETLASLVADPQNNGQFTSRTKQMSAEKRRIRRLPHDERVDNIPTNHRPSITSLAVGMKKIVTVHDQSYIRVWRFS